MSSHGGLNFYIGNRETATGFYMPVPGITPTIAGQEKDARRVAARALGHPVTDAEASDYFFGLSRDVDDRASRRRARALREEVLFHLQRRPRPASPVLSVLRLRRPHGAPLLHRRPLAARPARPDRARARASARRRHAIVRISSGCRSSRPMRPPSRCSSSPSVIACLCSCRCARGPAPRSIARSAPCRCAAGRR